MRKRNKKSITIWVIIIAMGLLLSIGVRYYREAHYRKGIALIDAGDYISAKNEFELIGDYKDAQEDLLYSEAMSELAKGEIGVAKNILNKISDFRNVDEILRSLEKEEKDAFEDAYQQAKKHFDAGEFETALIEFKVLDNYSESKDYIKKCYDMIRRKLAKTVSAGSLCSAALSTNEVLFTGKNGEQQDSLEEQNYVSISTGGFYTAGLTADGDVHIAGDIPWLDGKPNNSWKNVLQVSSGFDYVAVLFEDGTVDFQGENSVDVYDEPLDFSGWNNIKMIDAGYHLVVGLDAAGNIFVTGRNSSAINEEIHNNIEKWRDLVCVVTGGTSKTSEGYIAGLKEDGTVVVAGKTQYGIDIAEKWSGIKKISAGEYHLVGIKEDGTLISAINDNPADIRASKYACCDFTSWPDGVNIVDVAAGSGITLGLSADGIVYSCGFDKQGQIPVSGYWKAIKVYQ